MNRLRLEARAIGVISMMLGLAMPMPLSAAQDVYDTEMLSRHADAERHRQLVKATVGRNAARKDARATITPKQRQACAAKTRFRAQHGADDPRVRFLFQRCREAGL